MTFARVILIIDTIAFGLFGLAYVFFPNALEQLVTGGAFESSAAVTDARAIYGGMAFGIASLFWLCAGGSRDVRRVGIVGSALTYGFIAVARIVGIAVDGHAGGLMYTVLSTEILGVVLSVLAVNTLRSETASS